jgi:hypothetical protein
MAFLRIVIPLYFFLEHDLSDLAPPAEAGFAKAGNRYPLFGIMLQQKRGAWGLG